MDYCTKPIQIDLSRQDLSSIIPVQSTLAKIRSQLEPRNPIIRIGIIGAGSMGSIMSLGLAKKNISFRFGMSTLGIFEAPGREPSKKAKSKTTFEGFFDLRALADSFGDQKKLLIVSISQGKPSDRVLKLLNEVGILKPDDIVLDGRIEHWRITERLQEFYILKE
ncbi:uncharacterized protein RAG0_16141 [Rhynchosporium agropyri]|uniref:6-phosphogluconate dehydrogenase NADP-binding domain-containing protein n=1 Tax=Rhynchosporium agropyri TaxID=914238 RepID=A0A1E1LP19_9HELO|nr:uncharacterized protein RAG0_16141 [Rhynchosporium agropyri]